MRGDERVQDGMFSYVSLEQRVPADHPLRAVRKLTDTVLRSLNVEFDAPYADSGRPSIAPEYILRALLLQVFYSVLSERLLVEQIDYNLLFRWFVGLGMDDAVWNHAVFSKNRDRLLTSDVAQRFFAEVNRQAKHFMSDEHFTVDGTLIAGRPRPGVVTWLTVESKPRRCGRVLRLRNLFHFGLMVNTLELLSADRG
jgi:transposase